jgi:hypothetical protein
MSGLMTQLAQVTLQTEPVKTSNKFYLRLSAEITTYSKWDTFFKIRDLYESYVNPTNLKPSLYRRSINEGGYTKTEKYIYLADGKTIKSTSRKKNRAEINSTFTINSSSQDVISMAYKIRTIDFTNYKVGQVKTCTIVFDEKEFPVSIKYMGKETVSAGNLGSKECYCVSISAKTDKLKGKDKNLIWLTADSKKIPVLVKFSIKIGTGQVSLSNASGI